MFKILDRVSAINPFNEEGLKPSTVKGRIEFVNVSFKCVAQWWGLCTVFDHRLSSASPHPPSLIQLRTLALPACYWQVP